MAVHAGAGSGSAPGKGALWAGRVLSALPILGLTASGAMKIMHHPKVVEQLVGKFGYSDGSVVFIGVLELVCVLLYAIPQTAVLGAILVTGYLGGAVATHVRVADPWFTPAIIGMVAWGGLYFRDPRVRELLPLRR